MLLAMVFAGGAAAAPAEEYMLLYTEQVAEFTGEGTLGEGDAKSFRFVVSQPNVTRVDFVLTWTETGDRVRVSGPDRFGLTVFPPGDKMLPRESSATGELRVREDRLNPVPEGGPASASEIEARMAAAEGHEGIGEWRAVVKLESVGNPDGASVDEGNDFTLTVRMTYYEGAAMRVVSLSNPKAPLLDVEERSWGFALGGLSLVALGLGVTLLLQGRRRRLSRIAVTSAAGVSPAGDTAPASER